ncbi:hypothetical protein [Calothrix sp. UHCC 0171]|uniref:hypothetical protein n=1 Tax=Calothrix sp. UHCC 0171 TaxID=3110245 RepID=UPI002B1ECA31|nr:hypothetical protein [Calothrix sp. UHCC 0171]MEA5572384.1 hypothetical protein [Calothrix sp. UHCC 0171]
MNQKKWRLFVLIGFCVTLFFTACVPDPQLNLACDLTQKNPTPPELLAPLKISMYVDGTPSMAGYVTHPTNSKTRYVQTIDALEQILFIGSKQRNVSQEEYYRLGEKAEKIATGRQGYLEAKQKKFYDGSSYPLLKTVNIENAISPAQENQLNVIITDLYQGREDVTNINRKIESSYFSDAKSNYSVGIIAIKSEFNGKVYTEDTTNNTFLYNTNDAQGKAIKEFRPFYVIFLGQYSDISYYFNKIKESKNLPEDSQITIFSPNFLMQELSFVDSTPKIQPENSATQILSVSNPRIEVNQKKIHLFEVSQTSKDEVIINYTVPVKTYNNTSLPFSEVASQQANNIETETKTQIFNTLDRKLQDKPELAKALELSQWQKDNQNNLKFVTKIKPGIFPEPGFYYFVVDAKAKGIEPEKWWKEWSSDNNTNADWKTFNLEVFLKGLKASTDRLMQESKPLIGRFCYGINQD